MALLTLLISFLMTFSSVTWAEIHPVYQPNSPEAYITLRPRKGLYLGQMMRNIGLRPDWANRQWIRMIHRANPQQVNWSGDILFHSQEIRVPLAALQKLRGFEAFQAHLQSQPPDPYLQAQGPPPQGPEEAPPQEPGLDPSMTQALEKEPLSPIDEPLPPSPFKYPNQSPQRAPSPPSGTRFDTILGGGGDNLQINDGLVNETNLRAQANVLLKLDLLMQKDHIHRFNLALTSQLKTYTPPLSVGYTPDQFVIFDLEYGYHVRIFGNSFLQLIGRSKQSNFVGFLGNSIFLETTWGHSAGLGFETGLFETQEGIVNLILQAQLIYANSLEPKASQGTYVTLGFQYEPPGINEGWVMGVSLNYLDQKPEGYHEHSSLEALALLGYAF